MDVKGSLTHKIGPLPAWAWGLVAGGGVGLFVLYKKGALGSSSTAASTDSTGTSSDPTGTGTDGSATGAGSVPDGTLSLDPSGLLIPMIQNDQSQLATDAASLAKAQSGVAAYKALYEKWKTQAAKNAKTHRTVKTVVKTRYVAKPKVAKPAKPTVAKKSLRPKTIVHPPVVHPALVAKHGLGAKVPGPIFVGPRR